MSEFDRMLTLAGLAIAIVTPFYTGIKMVIGTELYSQNIPTGSFLIILGVISLISAINFYKVLFRWVKEERKQDE